MKSRKINICIQIFLLLFLTGCTPREKTVLLPPVQVLDTESGETAPAEDFTVKSIYTYEYETLDTLEQSAFLSSCGEHEIRIIANEDTQSSTLPVCRIVDYRYGFYDPAGASETPWETPEETGHSLFWKLWNIQTSPEESLETGDRFEDDLYYIEKLLPSPDGKQMLIYAAAESWNNRLIWLYDFEAQRSWLLYSGAQFLDGCDGSFSPDGQWVAFDIRGESTSDGIPVYDCQKDLSRLLSDDEWILPDDFSSFYYPPDRMLPIEEFISSGYWDADLQSTANGPGILNFSEEDSNIRVHLILPDSSYNFTSNTFYLYGIKKSPDSYIQYELDLSDKQIYYLANSRQLWNLSMEEGTTDGALEFSDSILLFHRLDTGEFLAVTARSSQEIPEYMNGSYSSAALDELLSKELLSKDLCLYSADGTGEQLLYRNLPNVISMEYDEETRRILLETTDDSSGTQRKCIVLEM